MASCEIRMLGSSGKSAISRRLICSGLQHVPQRRSARRPCRRRFRRTRGPLHPVLTPRGGPGRSGATGRSRPACSASDDGAPHVRPSTAPRRRGSAAAAAGLCVPAQLAGDGGGRALQVPSDCAHAVALGLQHGQLLAFRERQIPARQRRQVTRWQLARRTEPAPPPAAPVPRTRWPPQRSAALPRCAARTPGAPRAHAPPAVRATASVAAPSAPKSDLVLVPCNTSKSEMLRRPIETAEKTAICPGNDCSPPMRCTGSSGQDA